MRAKLAKDHPLGVCRQTIPLVVVAHFTVTGVPDSTQTALWCYVRSAADNRSAVNGTRADTVNPEIPAGKGDADVCYQRTGPLWSLASSNGTALHMGLTNTPINGSWGVICATRSRSTGLTEQAQSFPFHFRRLQSRHADGTTGGIQKGAKFFYPLPVCFLSLSLDEEELGAKLPCIVARRLMIFMRDGAVGIRSQAWLYDYQGRIMMCRNYRLVL